MLPVLTLLADFRGMVGGLFIAVAEVHVGATFYLSTIQQSVHVNDVLHGLFKTPFFGFEIAMIGCYNGLNASGGADGVGARRRSRSSWPRSRSSCPTFSSRSSSSFCTWGSSDI